MLGRKIEGNLKDGKSARVRPAVILRGCMIPVRKKALLSRNHKKDSATQAKSRTSPAAALCCPILDFANLKLLLHGRGCFLHVFRLARKAVYRHA